MIRFGTITEMRPADGTARVRFAEDGIVSTFLPVLYPKTKADRFTWSLDPDEHVACLMDENAENGVILGAIYSANTKPEGAGQDLFAVQFSDGTRIEFNRDTHKLTIQTDGDVEIKCDQATIDGDLKVTGSVDATGEVSTGPAAAKVRLSTHLHPTGTGPSGPPVKPS